MPYADLLGSYNQNMPSGYANDPSSFSDSFGANLYSVYSSLPVFQNTSNYNMLSERDAKLKEFGFDFSSKIKNDYETSMLPLFGESLNDRTARLREDADIASDAIIMERRKADPASPIAQLRTTQEIRQLTVDTRLAAEEDAAKKTALADSAFVKYGGSLSGSLLGVMMDPINALSMPLGASASTGIMRAMAIDGAINMGIEALQTPENKAWAEESGHEYGFGTAALNIGTAGAGGAVLSGLTRGVAKVLTDGISFNVFDKISKDKTLPPEARDAASYNARVAQIDENSPLGKGIVSDEAVAINRSNVAEIQDALENGRQPNFDARLFDIMHSKPPQAAAFNTGEMVKSRYRDYSIPSTQDMKWIEGAVIELENSYKGKRIFREVDGQGGTNVVTGYKGDFPKWFQSLGKDTSISTKKVRAVFEKMKQGKPLGKAEIEIARTLHSEGRHLREQNVNQMIDFRSDREANAQRIMQDEMNTIGAREEAAVGVIQDPDLLPSLRADERRIEAEISEANAPIKNQFDERPKLPKGLSGAKPRYRQSKLAFESDIDRAAYTVAGQKTKSKSHSKYEDFLKKHGYSASDIQGLYRELINKIKSLDDGREIIDVGEIGLAKGGAQQVVDTGALELDLAKVRQKIAEFEKETARAPVNGAQSTDAQTSIPGTEPITQRQLAERKMAEPMRGGNAPMDGGLFDVAGRGQGDMFSPSPSRSGGVVDDYSVAGNQTPDEYFKQSAEEVANPDVVQAMYADFDRMVRDFPDVEIMDESGVMKTIRELSEENRRDDLVMQAISTCGLGK